MSELYIGLMSGTSMDGIDAALVEFTDESIKLLGSYSQNIPSQLKQKVITLSQDTDQATIDMLGETDHELGQYFAKAVNTLLEHTNYSAKQITAIGSHGQTIRHRPDLKNPFSLQIADANIIAYDTGITTVADFRRKDMAAKGQGAPLAPAFHQQVFSSTDENRAVLNIGGIANLTYLPKAPADTVFGFDCGPGNGLMDAWIYKHLQKDYDEYGNWAASTEINHSLLEKLMQDPFIQQAPPKSTGKEHYNLNWLEQQLRSFELSPAEIQATLSQFTCDCIVYALQNQLPDIDRLIVCGGGIHNAHLIWQLKKKCPELIIESSADHLIDPDWVEAIAFAWLARQAIHQRPGNLASVTGAKEEVILGAMYYPA